MDPRTKSLMILASCMGLSFAVLILTCAFYSNWLPMTMLAPLALLPIPVLFMDMFERNADGDEGARAWLSMMQCLVGALVVAFYGIPIVAVHADKIDIGPFILWMVANLLTTAAIVYYFMKRKEDY